MWRGATQRGGDAFKRGQLRPGLNQPRMVRQAAKVGEKGTD